MIHLLFVINGVHGRVVDKKPFHKELKRREKAEVCQISQELGRKSVATGQVEGCILPTALT